MARSPRPEGLQAWTVLCAAVDSVRIALNRDLLTEAGLTLADNLTLCQVAMAPRARIRMVELATRLGVAKSAITKTVDRLEDRGLLVRERDHDDRRSVYATLTDQGARTFASAQPAYLASIQQHFTTHIDPSDLRALHRACATIAPLPGD
jgi:DNA-binding MarR family transcriptional regulator